MPRTHDITRLLNQWASGSEAALHELMPLVLEELRRLARHALAASPGTAPTLQPTALVNEAYLRLVGVQVKGFENRSRFFSLAARLIRGVLVDYARSRHAQKRWGQAATVPLDDALGLGAAPDLETLLAVGEALDRLLLASPRQGQVAELRLFSGLTLPEIAGALACSVPTVERAWAVARRRLARDLQAPGWEL